MPDPVLQHSNDQVKGLAALNKWLCSTEQSLFTMTGDAGTGKTTLLSEVPQSKTHFCAPTGKAADVMRSKGIPATTIHKLIYNRTPQGFVRVSSLPKPIIAIDEGSMISLDVWRDILALHKRVIVVGDRNQLPPVGQDPHLFNDPSVHLTELHRFAKDSPIISFSQQLRDVHSVQTERATHESPDGSSSVRVDSPARAIALGLESYDPNTTMFITARNLERKKINAQIRRLLGFEDPGLALNDLIVCRRNNYRHGIFNGQLFFVRKIDRVTPDLALCTLESYDDQSLTESVPISVTHFNSDKKPPHRDTLRVCLFDHGYCLTCHYAQGSEFDRVIVIEPPGIGFIFRDLSAHRWRYTAATRAKTHLVYGSPYIKD